MFYNKSCSYTFLKIHRKKPVPGLTPATLLKKRLWHRCFPVNFTKFLRNLFYRTPTDDCFFMTEWCKKTLDQDNHNITYFHVYAHNSEINAMIVRLRLILNFITIIKINLIIISTSKFFFFTSYILVIFYSILRISPKLRRVTK